MRITDRAPEFHKGEDFQQPEDAKTALVKMYFELHPTVIPDIQKPVAVFDLEPGQGVETRLSLFVVEGKPVVTETRFRKEEDSLSLLTHEPLNSVLRAFEDEQYYDALPDHLKESNNLLDIARQIRRSQPLFNREGVIWMGEEPQNLNGASQYIEEMLYAIPYIEAKEQQKERLGKIKQIMEKKQ